MGGRGRGRGGISEANHDRLNWAPAQHARMHAQASKYIAKFLMYVLWVGLTMANLYLKAHFYSLLIYGAAR